MTRDDLTKAQVQQLHATILRYHRFLMKLTDRMNRRGFAPDDPLLVKAFGAQSAIHTLSVELHYLSCDSGAGEPPRQRKAEPPHGMEALGWKGVPRDAKATGEINP
jgi:hypothetical protein